MCNLEQWTLVDANGTRHPRQRLYPCHRTTAAHTPCNNVRVYTLNDEVLQPAPFMIQPPQSILKKKGKKEDMKDGLRLEWEIKGFGKGKEKKKSSSPPTPTTPNSMQRPAQVSLTQPLVPAVAAPIQQQFLPPYQPPPQEATVIVPMSHSRTPPRSPRIKIIQPQPTREHRRSAEIVIEKPRSHSRSSRYRTRYREHERPVGAARHSPRHSRDENRRARSPSPATLLRREQEKRRRDQEEARIDAEIRRLNDLAERRRIERQAAVRNAAREEELARLDRKLEELQAEITAQNKAKRQVRVVVHHDEPREYEYEVRREELPRRTIYRTDLRERERSRSSSRGRRRVILDPLPPRREVREAIEAAPTEYEFIPVRRGRSVSEMGPRPRVREYVVLEDEERRWSPRRR